MTKRTIHVRAHDRTLGDPKPKWILIVYHDGMPEAMTSMKQGGYFTRSLGRARLYYKRQLNVFCDSHFGKDWRDSANILVFAVR